jgi:H+/Cl- antiporter ClcA
MEHLLEHVAFLEDKEILRGYVFGLIHSGLIMIGYYAGWSINRLLKLVSNGYLAGIFGAIIAHVLADFLASLADPHMRSAALGIVAGGLIPLFFIPLLEKYVAKSKHHIMIGDHEDIKKDLEIKHK